MPSSADREVRKEAVTPAVLSELAAARGPYGRLARCRGTTPPASPARLKRQPRPNGRRRDGLAILRAAGPVEGEGQPSSPTLCVRFWCAAAAFAALCLACSPPDDGPQWAGDNRADAGSAGGEADAVLSPGPDGSAVPPNDAEPAVPDAPPGRDQNRPGVISAFSPDGTKVVVRFDEPVAVEGAGDAESYTIRGTDNSLLEVASAEPKGDLVTLVLAATEEIVPELTYICYVHGVTDLAGNLIDPSRDSAVVRRTVYLALIWNHHQPLYYDAKSDRLSGPWVRKHATKDYYDMAAVVAEYPNVHLTVDLSTVLLRQLRIYTDRLLPFVDKEASTVDAEAFLGEWKGKTDPFIDLLLEPTPSPETATDAQKELLYDGVWSCKSTCAASAARWPQYMALMEKNPKLLTKEDLLALKVFFELAWFDPDFLVGPVALPTGEVVDLSDVVMANPDGTYTLPVPPTEALANRLVAEGAKVMEAVVPIHQALMYDPVEHEGQIEVVTTPYHHPILPLLVDTDVAAKSMPFDAMPDPPFRFPLDAEAQILKGVAMYQELFGAAPRGMWCPEGAVSDAVASVLAKAGVEWTATDEQALHHSDPSVLAPLRPYRVDGDSVPGDGGDSGDEVLVVFRNTQLSNDIGFAYQTLPGTEAAAELMADLTGHAPKLGEPDGLVTVLMNGECAWESYTLEHDGKGFHRALYAALDAAAVRGEVVAVTVSEYIHGNVARGIPPHPAAEQEELEPLWPGSWIDASFSIWIGEDEENTAWGYLRKARADLLSSGLERPDPLAPPPASGSSAHFIWKAFESVYAAEYSDWFFWYGYDMWSPWGDDAPFDAEFRAHLYEMYAAMNAALALEGKAPLPVPVFPAIVAPIPKTPSGPFSPGAEPLPDGKLVPNEAEWVGEGGVFYDDDSGSLPASGDDIGLVYYGYSAEALYVAVIANEDLVAKLGSPYELLVYTSHKHILDLAAKTFEAAPANQKTRNGSELDLPGGAAREIRVRLDGASPVLEVNAADGAGGWAPVAHGSVLGGPGPYPELVELRIPFEDLGLAPGDPLRFVVFASEGGPYGYGEDVDRAPSAGSKEVFPDPLDMVVVTLECDVTGKQVPIDIYTEIASPPPPVGTGIVYVTGNQEALAHWVPNKVPFLDTGTSPDAVAGDGIWTAAFDLPRGTKLQYRYTIGLPKDEGKWAGTEEFPLTVRGLDVPEDPEKTAMLVRDVFADRPKVSGTKGQLTTIEIW